MVPIVARPHHPVVAAGKSRCSADRHPLPMPRRPKVVERGHTRGVELTALIQRELRIARVDRGLSQGSVAAALGIDRSWVSRVERAGLTTSGSSPPPRCSRRSASSCQSRPIHRVARCATPRMRPCSAGCGRGCTPASAGQPRSRCPWSATCAPGTRSIRGRLWRCGVEAETRPTDLQALERRLALKQRDGAVDVVFSCSSTAGPTDASCASTPMPSTSASRSRAVVPSTARGWRLPGGNAIVLL